MKNFKVWNLGLIKFDTALKIQMALARRHLDALAKGQEGPSNTLLLLEHDPVYTVGLRDDTPDSEITRLTKLGAEFRKTNRGGLITFHGPGQLVAYPIVNLKNYKPSVKWYVNALEETVIRMSFDFGIIASRSPNTGVWVGDNKLAAIGIHASRYITTHGIAVNCDADLTWFNHIVPCGIEGKGVTSITKEVKIQKTVKDVIPLFIKSFEEVFRCETEPVSTKTQEDILKGVYQAVNSVPS